MLTLLNIKNLALVDSLTWNLGMGLIGVTGETGAGKSVIIGALKLIVGERADKGIIRTNESSCSVEAVFELKPSSQVWRILRDEAGMEVEIEDGLIIRRVVTATSNKQFINNSPVTLSLLKKIGFHLVDLHGPHDHQSLLSNELQRSMLDAFCGASETYVDYKTHYDRWRSARQQLDNAINSDKSADHELELLRYQLEEIESADIQPNEEENVESAFKKASNGSQLVAHASQVGSILGSGLTSQLADIQRNLRELEKLDPEIAESFANVDSAIMELQDLEVGMSDYVETIQVDDAELQRLEGRINIFETLKRKYGPSLEDVSAHGEVVQGKLELIENRDSIITDLEKETHQSLEAAQAAAGQLSVLRKKKAPKLAKEIITHLKDLGFKQAEFSVKLTRGKLIDADGWEKVDFQFGPNPGEPLKPLKQIASSGEISRVMLSLKSALASQEMTPLMVFDEIDANVGGEIARSVGEKMATLGEHHQVISISHFPQVAAVADLHFLVEKTIEKDRAVSKMHQVQGGGRVDEIVRMLGAGENKQSREMAINLLSKDV